MARGTLRIYLGAAAGVGKTFAMLNEGHRRAEYGEDVVVGLVETHGRRKTAQQIGGLEVVPRKRVEYRGSAFEELDVEGVNRAGGFERLLPPARALDQSAANRLRNSAIDVVDDRLDNG